jgi:hypothetical protein
MEWMVIVQIRRSETGIPPRGCVTRRVKQRLPPLTCMEAFSVAQGHPSAILVEVGC